MILSEKGVEIENMSQLHKFRFETMDEIRRLMNKFDRLIFDIGCIILIIILPYFVLKMIGIVDYVENGN